MTETSESDYPLMFSPIQIGPIELRNRLVMSAMTTGFGFDQGRPTRDICAYFERRCADVGMAVVAFGAVAPEGRVEQQIPWMWEADAGEFMRPLAEAISSVGAVPCLQLGHGGRQVSPKVTGQTPVGPSAVAPDVHVKDPPHELTIIEVETIVAAFGSAAQKAAAAGFKAIELHGAHGYLVQQFLSPKSNIRDDRYGGDTIERRAQFGIEVIEAIRNHAPQLALSVRINGDDISPGGMTPSDAATVAAIFEAAGAHAILVSAGVYGSVPYTIPLLDDPEATFIDAAAVVRQQVTVPVIAVGRITSPETAESILASGHCDAVAIGRALLADPDWMRKAVEGNTADIRPCIATVQGCAGMLQHGEAISCAVNPEVGREAQTFIRSKAQHRKVLIVGAGPAGVEAAMSAVKRGHSTTLVEQRTRIGGALQIAASTPPLGHIERLIQWYERQLASLDIDLKLNTEADTTLVKDLDPDVVILATGGATDIPTIEGYDLLPTWCLEDAISGLPSTLETMKLPNRLVVVGGGQRSLAGALWAISQGSSVSILTPGRLGEDTSGLSRRALIQRLLDQGAEIHKGELVSILEEGVLGLLETGEQILLKADGVLLGDPIRATIPTGFASLECQVIRIGDCKSPRDIAAAVIEGQEALASLS